jgi:hypothetical protein
VSPVGIFFMYLVGALAAGGATVAAVDVVAPEVADDIKKHVFRRRRRPDSTQGNDESVR